MEHPRINKAKGTYIGILCINNHRHKKRKKSLRYKFGACIECMRLTHQRYYQNNKKKVKKNVSAYNENNKKSIKKRKQLWYLKNKKHRQKKDKAYHKANKERINKRNNALYRKKKKK
jgi:hypothetical protein